MTTAVGTIAVGELLDRTFITRVRRRFATIAGRLWSRLTVILKTTTNPRWNADEGETMAIGRAPYTWDEQKRYKLNEALQRAKHALEIIESSVGYKESADWLAPTLYEVRSFVESAERINLE